MVFNPILGMGRSPMVTQDFISDPYGIGYDVTYLSQPYETQLQMTVTGSLLAPINPNFDYENNQAYYFERNGTSLTNIFGYKFNKTIIMKNINILYSMVALGNCTTLIEVSSDGVNFETVESNSLTNGNSSIQKLVTIYDKKVREIRFTVTLATVGAGNTTFELHKIEEKSDPYQLS